MRRPAKPQTFPFASRGCRPACRGVEYFQRVFHLLVRVEGARRVEGPGRRAGAARLSTTTSSRPPDSTSLAIISVQSATMHTAVSGEAEDPFHLPFDPQLNEGADSSSGSMRESAAPRAAPLAFCARNGSLVSSSTTNDEVSVCSITPARDRQVQRLRFRSSAPSRAKAEPFARALHHVTDPAAASRAGNGPPAGAPASPPLPEDFVRIAQFALNPPVGGDRYSCRSVSARMASGEPPNALKPAPVGAPAPARHVVDVPSRAARQRLLLPPVVEFSTSPTSSAACSSAAVGPPDLRASSRGIQVLTST